MTSMTKKMSEAGSGRPETKDVRVGTPKKGDCFRCQRCGMEVQITADCGCNNPGEVHFHCCGQELTKR